VPTPSLSFDSQESHAQSQTGDISLRLAASASVQMEP